MFKKNLRKNIPFIDIVLDASKVPKNGLPNPVFAMGHRSHWITHTHQKFSFVIFFNIYVCVCDCPNLSDGCWRAAWRNRAIESIRWPRIFEANYTTPNISQEPKIVRKTRTRWCFVLEEGIGPRTVVGFDEIHGFWILSLFGEKVYAYQSNHWRHLWINRLIILRFIISKMFLCIRIRNLMS